MNLKKIQIFICGLAIVLSMQIFSVSCLSRSASTSVKAEEILNSYQPLKYGLFVHYVPGGAMYPDGRWCNDLNELANVFDVQAFADDLAAMQVEYVIFTAWHANMNLLYPSEKMNYWRPGHSANRDMIGDLTRAVKAKGIKVYYYTHPRDGHDFRNDQEKEATGWGAGKNLKEGWNPNWANFDFAKWNNFINEIYGEFVDRYGNEIDGIWIDEGSPAGDSYRVVDYGRLRKTIKTRNPNLTIINNFYGTTYACDLGMKEYGPGWGEFAQSDGSKWPAYTLPVGACFAGNWSATSSLGKNDVQFSASDMFRYTILEAGTNTVGGGVAWATGPYAGKGWGTGVLDTLVKVGKLIEPIASSIKQTLPSTSYPTISGKTINDLSWGVATRSIDNKLEYLHVLIAPDEKTLVLPAPEDEKLFESAMLLKNGKSLSIKQTADGVELTLPADESWDAINTVIQLTVSGVSPVAETYQWMNDTESGIVYEGRGWEYSRWERKHGDFDNDVHLTPVLGDELLYAFTGTGIEYIVSQSKEQGRFDVYLDGKFQESIDAYSDNYQAQKLLFRKYGLNKGRHVLRIVNAEKKQLSVDAFKVITLQ
ncbi:MAG: alpha-L-fucosidase [Prolixibacteraceae bacterium]|nr:alpha-L-fucosidase [Prolixibacteraceae bacterium]